MSRQPFKSERHAALDARYPRVPRRRPPVAPRTYNMPRWPFVAALLAAIGTFVLTRV